MIDTASQAMPLQEMSPQGRARRLLRQWIHEGQWPAGERLPAEQRLAEQLAVSRGTVRLVLRDLADQGLLQGRPGGGWMIEANAGRTTLVSQTVVLLTGLPTLAESHHSRGWEKTVDLAALDAVQEAGLHSMSLNPLGLGEEGLRRLLLDRPQGVIAAHRVAQSPEGHAVLARLAENGVRLVAHGGHAALRAYDRVMADYEAASYQLTRWLIDKGCRRILRLWWDVSGDAYWIAARNAGHERAMRESGLNELPPVYSGYVPGCAPHESDEQCFRARMRQTAGFLIEHLKQRGTVDAVMAPTDSAAYCVASACRLFDLKPNRDVLIVGYDNYWRECVERAWEPAVPLATVDKDHDRIGREMVRLLLARIGGGLPAEAQQVVVPSKLVIGEQA